MTKPQSPPSIKIPKSLFSARKLIKVISGHSTEMLTIVLTIRNIVQLSTINIFFYKTFFSLPVFLPEEHRHGEKIEGRQKNMLKPYTPTSK